MSAASNSPAAWEHTLPYRVLIAELRVRRPKAVPDDVEQLLGQLDVAQAKLRNLREQPVADLEQYNAALNACAGCERPLKKILHNAKLSALCFSGGGIRSASLGLGVLWQLARQSWNPSSPANQPGGLLHQIDYVSTVSGGGYVGSWLTGWIKRHPQGLDGVVKELAAPAPTSADPEPAPVRHLRDYTSYLAPRSGLLSADMWTLAAILLRNLLLNWAILVAVFAAFLLLPVLDRDLFSRVKDLAGAGYFLGGSVLFAFFALAYTAWKLPGNYKVQPARTRFVWVGIPLLLSAWCLSVYCLHEYEYSGAKDPFHDKFWMLWLLAGIAHGGLLLGRIAVALRKKGRERAQQFVRNFLGQVVAALPSSAFAAWTLWLLAEYVGRHLLIRGDPRLFLSLSVPLIGIGYMLTIVLLNGLSAKCEAEEDREWWSRSGAFVLMGVVLWPLLHLLVLYSGEITDAATSVFWGHIPGTVSIPVLTGMIGAVASLAGFSPATASGHTKVDVEKLSRTAKFLCRRRLLIPALGSLFFILLAVALAQANSAIYGWLSKTSYGANPIGAGVIDLIAVFGLALLMNIFVNVNVFSLHAMYRGRLVRSYLGASNNKRKPNPFINFDPNDNFPMKDAPASQSAPLHIINMALNVVATKKLAWQQRKAESFTVSALHCGSFRVGYQPTEQYAGDSGITLGTAMGISGAAASPNMGYHSNPILALVMTFFNARLGWWLPNPRLAGRRVRRPGPEFSLWPLLNEALGRTTDDSPWVYLSDGGHFENLALYEMVLRRCKRIIVVDGSADARFDMEDLGNAVRKIYIDLGVPIEFDARPAFEPLPKTSPRHCYLARVAYSRVDGTPEQDDGRLLYIKASLTGNEPADVTQYAKSHPDFPHESTANQFFNESQFESYVRLGSDIVEQLVKQGFAGNPPSPMGLDDLFSAASAAGGNAKAAAASIKSKRY
jgi:Patatin-like phospholipase